MSGILSSPKYRAQLARLSALGLPWERLAGKTVFIAGASGLIGSALADLLMYASWERGLGCRVAALGRSSARLERRFSPYLGRDGFSLLAQDVCVAPSSRMEGLSPDYILHLASNTHPVAYASDPVGTIATNILGTKMLLDYAVRKGAARFLYASSVEIYGQAWDGDDRFAEDYCGYIDCNTLRAGYPESKRCGEALCQAYMRRHGVDAVIPRLARVYGPTMREDDSKAVAQFIRRAAAGEDIVLKSGGGQLFSYCYALDAAAALLYCLLLGQRGGAYNVADPGADITLSDLAFLLSGIAGVGVRFQEPDAGEAAGYSAAYRALLDPSRLLALGWRPLFPLREALGSCVAIAKEAENGDA